MVTSTSGRPSPTTAASTSAKASTGSAPSKHKFSSSSQVRGWQGCQVRKYLKGQIWPQAFSNKGKSSKMKKSRRSNFWRKFVKITERFLVFLLRIVGFAQIFPKQALKGAVFFNLKKWSNGQIISFLVNSLKWPNLAYLAVLNAKWQPWRLAYM